MHPQIQAKPFPPRPADRLRRARHFHVVGGGCFGTQYVRWLLRARSLGMLEFEKIFAVDRNPNCLLSRELASQEGLERVVEDWEPYLAGLLRSASETELESGDHWVPSPLSPHLIFEAFKRAAGDSPAVAGATPVKEATVKFIAAKFEEKLPPPIRIPLASGDQALSFAEWVCPVNCIEPPRCPAIQAPRDWDMKPCLEAAIEPAPGRSTHVLQCRHFVHGVGTIQMRDIVREYRKFQSALRGGDCRELVVATTSGCHGLISRALLQFEL